jgi:hypothetical protein
MRPPAAGEDPQHWLFGVGVPLNGHRRLHEAEVDASLLDPPAPPDVSWRERYAAELEQHPNLAFDLRPDQPPGDGIERVLERAGLPPGERVVTRAWLYGDDRARIAEELGWRPQTVTLLLSNGRWRLEHLRREPPTAGAVMA